MFIFYFNSYVLHEILSATDGSPYRRTCLPYFVINLSSKISCDKWFIFISVGNGSILLSMRVVTRRVTQQGPGKDPSGPTRTHLDPSGPTRTHQGPIKDPPGPIKDPPGPTKTHQIISFSGHIDLINKGRGHCEGKLALEHWKVKFTSRWAQYSSCSDINNKTTTSTATTTTTMTQQQQFCGVGLWVHWIEFRNHYISWGLCYVGRSWNEVESKGLCWLPINQIFPLIPFFL